MSFYIFRLLKGKIIFWNYLKCKTFKLSEFNSIVRHECGWSLRVACSLRCCCCSSRTIIDANSNLSFVSKNCCNKTLHKIYTENEINFQSNSKFQRWNIMLPSKGVVIKCAAQSSQIQNYKCVTVRGNGSKE